MTSDITAFVLARAAEREALARAATNDGPWRVDDAAYPEAIYSGDASVVAGGRWGGEGNVFLCDDDAHHIAHHDPVRVLREVAAVRAIMAEYDERFSDDVVWQPILRALASMDSDHPDCDPSWGGAQP